MPFAFVYKRRDEMRWAYVIEFPPVSLVDSSSAALDALRRKRDVIGGAVGGGLAGMAYGVSGEIHELEASIVTGVLLQRNCNSPMYDVVSPCSLVREVRVTIDIVGTLPRLTPFYTVF